MDPTETGDFLSRVAGLAIVLSVLAYVYRLSTNRGADVIDNFAGRISGGLLSSSGSGGGSIWEGV